MEAGWLMIFESIVLSALFYGLVSAATLPLGAAVGVIWRPPDRVMAVLLAFGGGALLAALTIDLIAPGVNRGHFPDLALGAMRGGLLFKLLDWLVNRRGGDVRKPSTAMTYWRGQARARLHRILQSVRRTQPMGSLSRDAEEKLLSVMLIRDLPAGSCLYRLTLGSHRQKFGRSRCLFRDGVKTANRHLDDGRIPGTMGEGESLFLMVWE